MSERTILSDAAVKELRRLLCAHLDQDGAGPDALAAAPISMAFELAAPGLNPFGGALRVVPLLIRGPIDPERHYLTDAAITLLRRILVEQLDQDPATCPDWEATVEICCAFHLDAPDGNPFGHALEFLLERP